MYKLGSLQCKNEASEEAKQVASNHNDSTLEQSIAKENSVGEKALLLLRGQSAATSTNTDCKHVAQPCKESGGGGGIIRSACPMKNPFSTPSYSIK